MRIGTQAENVADKVAKGRHRPGPGFLAPAVNAEIARRLLAGETHRTIAESVGVTWRTITNHAARLRIGASQ